MYGSASSKVAALEMISSILVEQIHRTTAAKERKE
jgi:hypothetical protein